MRLSKPTPPKPPKPSAVTAEDRKKIRLLLAQEEYENALNAMRNKIVDGASEQDFSSLYVIAMNGLISKGDSHLKKNEQARAGLAFQRALDNYPTDEMIQRKLKRPARGLRMTIKRITTDMMDTALLKYRAGALEEAIAIWDGLLSFDPQNAEALKARDTAKTQLENLRKIE